MRPWSRSTAARTSQFGSVTSSRSTPSSGRSGSSNRRERNRSGTCFATRWRCCPRERLVSAGRLLELTVGDLALIDRLRLTLGPGLNVITGETGAGKSLLIDALGLVRGSRADTGLVRHGAAGARVEALFDVDAAPEP